ncbi:uncharacterized protein MONBRDRAFT_27236 [Monosiga brevicollis MX1]|uniref:dolichyl-phosphate-mannose--protein mannosyltransferase n=1 Tax=Monosiga brevicollis TaxID=81824 RepID=A9V4P9_MONBE|nr:uncharacterized protein MONBRDRAFT_27236 [Monosiga brevicollis MX1]EDQ87493.1 predicted protein [Monosiga brevicollis MX1]|eukprot:XP_001747753.1 hypothetical protein [Monosiga brevicollis MX1]
MRLAVCLARCPSSALDVFAHDPLPVSELEAAEEGAEEIQNRIANLNVRLVQLMASALRVRGQVDAASQRRNRAPSRLDIAALMQMVQATPAALLEQQYEDFGLWHLVSEHTQRAFDAADKQLVAPMTNQPEAAAGDMDTTTEEDNLTTDGEGIDELLLMHCADDLDKLRQSKKKSSITCGEKTTRKRERERERNTTTTLTGSGRDPARVMAVMERWYPAVAAAVAVLVYLNSLHGAFVFDDMPAIKENADVDPAQTSWSHVFSSNFWGQPMGSQWSSHLSYRPFTTLTFRANFILHGYEPFGYHVINMLLHALATSLVALVGARCFQSVGAYQHHAAALAALLFAVHPVHAEAVANIVCRAELLSGIFYCWAFLTYDHACRQSKIGNGIVYICGAAVFATISMLCKEQGIMVLPCCIVYDLLVVDRNGLDLSHVLDSFLPSPLPEPHASTAAPTHKAADAKVPPNPAADTLRRRVQRKADRPSANTSAKARSAKATARASHNLSLPTTACLVRCVVVLVLTVLLYQWRVSLNKGDDVKNDEKTNPANHIDDTLLRWLTKNYYVFLHFWLLLVPWDLCCDWSSFGIDNIAALSDHRNLSTAAMYLVLVTAGFALLLSKVASRGVRHAILLGLAMMAINFVPASGLLVETGFVIAERILYLPSIGYCLAAAGIFFALFAEAGTHGRRVLVALALILLVLFGVRTCLRNVDWESEESLYKTGLAVLPNNAKLHHNYARSLQGRDADREYHYRVAIRQYKYYGSAYINLGVLLANQGKLEEAVEIWKAGLDAWNQRPILGQDPTILNLNIGTGLKNLGRYAEAVPFLERCLKLAPGKPNCANALNFVKQQLR